MKLKLTKEQRANLLQRQQGFGLQVGGAALSGFGAIALSKTAAHAGKLVRVPTKAGVAALAAGTALGAAGSIQYWRGVENIKQATLGAIGTSWLAAITGTTIGTMAGAVTAKSLQSIAKKTANISKLKPAKLVGGTPLTTSEKLGYVFRRIRGRIVKIKLKNSAPYIPRPKLITGS